MRRSCALIGYTFRFSTSFRSCYFTGNFQQVSYILPFYAGASCSVGDALQLFAHCNKRNIVDDGSSNVRRLFEENIMMLERLGVISLSHDDPHAIGMLETKRICRVPVLTIALHSIDTVSLGRNTLGDEAVMFQLLHGVIFPLMCSRAVTHGFSTPSSSMKQRLGDEVTADMCLSLLGQLKVLPSKASGSSFRFVLDLVNEVLLFGVSRRLLHPCGNGFFRMHYRMLQDKSFCLLTFQWWWWRRVNCFLRHALLAREEATSLSIETWISAAQARVRHLIYKQAWDLPQFFLYNSMDATMALVADAVRCWVAPQLLTASSPVNLAPPKWQLHLTDFARVSLALETVKAIKSCLAQRPAGVSVSELSQLILWPTLSLFLRKRSLLKSLAHFSFYFFVGIVKDVAVVQLQLSPVAKDEAKMFAAVEAWILVDQSRPRTSLTLFIQDVDLVVRVVAFLRKRHLRNVKVTFEELCAAVFPKTSSDNTAFLDILRRHDVVVVPSDEDENVLWEFVRHKEVRLSARESGALKAMEAFRRSAGDLGMLYREAIEPFLSRCNEEVIAGGVKDAALPISVLERWLQVERLSLGQDDLLKMLRDFSSFFVIDNSVQCIRLGNWTTKTAEGVITEPKIKNDMSTFSAAKVPSVLPPPPPPVSHCHQFTFNSQLLRVLNSNSLEALLHFAQVTVHAVFVLLLPQLSLTSGVQLRTLLRRVRWSSVAPTLGSLPSFLRAFEGLFFDFFADVGHFAEDSVVAAYRGHVGVWLIYARLIARLFPSNIDIPLRLVAEGLSWNLRFASRFGDLPSLLRRVGRCCHGGNLLAKVEPLAAPSSSYDDLFFWGLVEKIRHEAAKKRLEQVKEFSSNQDYVLLQVSELSCHVSSTEERTMTKRNSVLQLVDAAVRRFPFFFQWHTAADDPAPLVRIALPTAPAPSVLLSFVEEYVCPLLRQHHSGGVSIVELDDRLGWSRGCFDTHPAGIGVAGSVASVTSLLGLLRRYVEAAHPPRLLLLTPARDLADAHDYVRVRPNTDVYQSPEDMLLQVNGLESVEGKKGFLRPLGRPISIFELLAEERELYGRAGETVTVPREERWHVSLQCRETARGTWGKDFMGSGGDIFVWCEG